MPTYSPFGVALPQNVALEAGKAQQRAALGNTLKVREAGVAPSADEQAITGFRQDVSGRGFRERSPGRQAGLIGKLIQDELTRQQEFRSQQQGAIDLLRQQAEGTGGPSVAEQQLQRGLQQSLAQALGLARGQRGGNTLAALRGGQLAQERLSSEASGQAALLRAQEQMSARQALIQALMGARGQDIQVGGLQTGREGNFLNAQTSANQLALQQQALDFQKSQAQQDFFLKLLGAGASTAGAFLPFALPSGGSQGGGGGSIPMNLQGSYGPPAGGYRAPFFY